MPCYDHRNSPSYIHEHTVKPLQERVDQYAVWLCDLMKRIPVTEIHFLPEELQQWWKEHQNFDQKRSNDG